MIRMENQLGLIEVTPDYFNEIISEAVAGCYGVEGFGHRGVRENLRSMVLRREPQFQGVRVYRDGNGLAVDLRIIVTYGLNISAIVRSVINKVCYTVEESTGLKGRKVNVFVDGMRKPE